MKKALLFLIFLAIINSIESAEQPQALVNQGSAQVDSCCKTWDGWAWDPTTDLWVNMKTGEISPIDPRDNLDQPKALTK
jgi:hypothetical protein